MNKLLKIQTVFSGRKLQMMSKRCREKIFIFISCTASELNTCKNHFSKTYNHSIKITDFF